MVPAKAWRWCGDGAEWPCLTSGKNPILVDFNFKKYFWVVSTNEFFKHTHTYNMRCVCVGFMIAALES